MVELHNLERFNLEQLPLFVYGTLRRGQCNHHLLDGRYKRAIPATLHDFLRVHPMMIVPKRERRVNGELYFLHSDTYRRAMADCDELEEVSPTTWVGRDYRRLRVRVATEEGEYAAWAYVHPSTPGRWQDCAGVET